jgi:uncharacterized membrane protein YcaP (DUF421 family)
MLDMQLPWWEFILRGFVVYALLLLMFRLSGKRTVGQFTPFDLLVVMLLSEAVSNALTGGDESLIGGLIIAATLMALNFSLAFITARSSRMAGIVDGNAILLGRDGKIFHKVREREHVAEADIEKALREQDCELVEMSCLFLESDGSISVMKTKR